MPLASVKPEDDDRVSVEPSAVAGISAFLGKLWKMVEDPKTDHLISWGKVSVINVSFAAIGTRSSNERNFRPPLRL